MKIKIEVPHWEDAQYQNDENQWEPGWEEVEIEVDDETYNKPSKPIDIGEIPF